MIARLFLCLMLLLSCRAPGAAERQVVIEVDAGAYDRENTPVVFELPAALRYDQAFVLMETGAGKQVDVQFEPGPRPRVFWIVREKLGAGQTRRYRLSAASSRRPPIPLVSIEDDRRRLVINVGKHPVAQYNAARAPSPDPAKPEYGRSGYLHPLFDPDGRAITDDMAPDHAHQHGVMFPYENTTFQGRKVNFWEPANGTVAHDRMERIASGPVFGQFRAVLRHVETGLPGIPREVLRETWDVKVYNISEYFVLDFESVQNAATDSPLMIEKNSYGGLAIRCHRDWLDSKRSEYLTSEGKTRKDGNQTRPRWVDLYGVIDGKPSGVAILDHPSNFRFPQPVRIHPEKPYLCFAPMAVGKFEIEPGKPLVSRYRFYIHRGNPDREEIERVWHDYAEPPRVTVVPR